MVLKYDFRGFMAPVFTPFTPSYEVDYSIFPSYGNYLKNLDVKGVLVNGTVGEGVSLTTIERKLVTEEWIKIVKPAKQSLMVHIGGTSLFDVIDLAKHAEKLGVDALLCVSDLFFKPKTSVDLVNYLKWISKASPNTPLLYYHIPAFTNVNIDLEDFIEIACREVPTFAGIKYTHTDLEEASRCLKRCNDYGIPIFLGADQLLSAATVLGFDSAIATTLNLWPELLNKIQFNVKNGKIQEAIDEQNELNRRISCITQHGNWVSSMKAAMKLVSSIDMGTPRPPLFPLEDSQILDISNSF